VHELDQLRWGGTDIYFPWLKLIWLLPISDRSNWVRLKLAQANAVPHRVVCSLIRPRIPDASRHAQEACHEDGEWDFHPADRIPSNSRGGVNECFGSEAAINGLGRTNSANQRITELPWNSFAGEFSSQFGCDFNRSMQHIG
jgi:hypothetical protein